MTRPNYIVKIVPPWGYRVFRLEFAPLHVALAFAALVALAGTLAGSYALTLQRAETRARDLRAQSDDQRSRLQKIDAQAAELDGQLRSLRAQNDQIRRMIGSDGARRARSPAGTPAASRSGAQSFRPGDPFAVVAARIQRLRGDSARVRIASDGLRGATLRVLNMHRLEDLARGRLLAAIPSVNPAGPGVGIRSAFGWRVDPWPEFHKGVDLDADYGSPVRAGAAGTVVAAAYDGGYGNKIDVDHGNGYHTWYCHLERIDVKPGQYVAKAEHLGLVGSTGASTGPHLHYQIMLDGQAVDPAPYLTGGPSRVLASLK